MGRAGKSIDGESLNRRAAFTVTDEFGQDFANSRRDLESGSREAEGVNEVRRGPAEADHRVPVRHLAFRAAPEADGVGMAQSREQGRGAVHDGHGARARGAGEVGLCKRLAAHAADDAVAALDLARIDAAAFGADVHVHEDVSGSVTIMLG